MHNSSTQYNHAIFKRARLIGIIFYIIGFGYFLFKIINFFINKYYKNILIEKSYQEIILVTALLLISPLSPSVIFLIIGYLY